MLSHSTVPLVRWQQAPSVQTTHQPFLPLPLPAVTKTHLLSLGSFYLFIYFLVPLLCQTHFEGSYFFSVFICLCMDLLLRYIDINGFWSVHFYSSVVILEGAHGNIITRYGHWYTLHRTLTWMGMLIQVNLFQWECYLVHTQQRGGREWVFNSLLDSMVGIFAEGELTPALKYCLFPLCPSHHLIGPPGNVLHCDWWL